MKTQEETIVLGGGCFWCIEAVFKMLKGVSSAEPGYAGGEMENPTYEDVCTGGTGHAEVIRVVFDSKKISLDDILTVFFASHDPTTPNRQGGDVGPQYRSLILYTTEAQQAASEKYISTLNAETGGKPIVTQLEPLGKFFPAENYHKDYYSRNQNAGYCQVVINPKLAKVREKFGELVRASNS